MVLDHLLEHWLVPSNVLLDLIYLFLALVKGVYTLCVQVTHFAPVLKVVIKSLALFLCLKTSFEKHLNLMKNRSVAPELDQYSFGLDSLFNYLEGFKLVADLRNGRAPELNIQKILILLFLKSGYNCIPKFLHQFTVQVELDSLQIVV